MELMMDEALRSVKINVRGTVQGVSFRAGTRDQAQRLGLQGFVRNLPDGSVYAEVEGTSKSIASLLGWCRKGTPNAYVRVVAVENQNYQGHVGFSIQKN